ncbi:MAG: rod shape-determining protein RodA [Gammaproteobacteria bacterium]|nr:rod shape-determining protein RodA [Gammaproteobacteria bacterium]
MLLTRKKSFIRDVFHIDLPTLALLIFISSFGLLILYSAVGREVDPFLNQSAKISLGFLAMFVLAQIPPILFMRIAPWFFLLALFLLVATFFYGVEVKGSRRWLRIPGFISFQPSELMKLALPLMLARYFQNRHLPPRPRNIFWATIMIAVPVFLIGVQPDLGTSLILIITGVFLLFVAGIPWRLVFSSLAIGLLSMPLLWSFMHDYQRQRILILFDPESDALGAGWNIIQSKTAIGSGGVFGKGLFQGTQSNLDFLPETRTDFILAVLGEELGFSGIVLLLSMYGLLIARGVLLAVNAQDTFGRLVSISIVFTFFVYVFVNIGMVIGILPVVGVPLPFVSYGGTSVLTLFAGFGILMSIQNHRRISL